MTAADTVIGGGDGPRCVIGLISDTHGLLRPEALAALAGCDRIVHAGDIGGPEILAALAERAPLTAVRGNNDRAAWATALPATARLVAGGAIIEVIHDLAEWSPAAAEGVQVVISGHSHRPAIVRRDGRLFVNPGSAGPRRFSLPIAMGRLVIEAGRVAADVFELAVAAPAARKPRATGAASGPGAGSAAVR